MGMVFARSSSAGASSLSYSVWIKMHSWRRIIKQSSASHIDILGLVGVVVGWKGGAAFLSDP